MTPDQVAALAVAPLPVEIMQFTLIYDGPLPAGDNKRTLYASKVRNHLHSQLADLWDSHVVMRQLARTARVPKDGIKQNFYGDITSVRLSEYRDPIPPVLPNETDLCEPLLVEKIGLFRPLVRPSLRLACSIDILFLRHEEPMHLFVQGGDLDNRIKCFFDGLKMPDPLGPNDTYQGELLEDEPLCVLLEDDRWIADFSVKTGRLLGQGEKMRHAVSITANVRVKVLRVTDPVNARRGGA